MAKIKAIIVGVSKSLHEDYSDLPFCRNDIYEIRKAFIQGLGVMPEDILICGENGYVTEDNFVKSIPLFARSCDKDDVLLFYFSGHGTNSDSTGDHHLVLTDSFVSTQFMISFLGQSPAKSIVLFFDCCYAGNFEVNGSAQFDMEKTIDSFAGCGCAVLASSNALQCSFPHPDKPISLFTSFLCDAIICPATIKDGQKSLNDIQKLLFLMIERWNKKTHENLQSPIFRANMGGTIFFPVGSYIPYTQKDFFFEGADYIICSVKQSHGMNKRYCVNVILKSIMSYTEIAVINHEIIALVRNLDIFANPQQEKRWKNKPASHIFCFFGLSETDIVNQNYYCSTTWVDDWQDKSLWYKTGNHYETIDNICFHTNPHYDFMKQHIEIHTATKEELIENTNSVMHQLISLAEQIISIYNEFRNGEKDEADLIRNIELIAPQVRSLYREESNLDIPPKELVQWSQQCSLIAGIIYDFALYHCSQNFLNRSPENRRACMDMSIKQYYKELENLKDLEKEMR